MIAPDAFVNPDHQGTRRNEALDIGHAVDEIASGEVSADEIAAPLPSHWRCRLYQVQLHYQQGSLRLQFLHNVRSRLECLQQVCLHKLTCHYQNSLCPSLHLLYPCTRLQCSQRPLLSLLKRLLCRLSQPSSLLPLVCQMVGPWNNGNITVNNG